MIIELSALVVIPIAGKKVLNEMHSEYEMGVRKGGDSNC